jgi:hypothetical protein
MASTDPEVSKQGANGKRKYSTLTISQKLQITRRLDSGKTCNVIMAAYDLGLSSKI